MSSNLDLTLKCKYTGDKCGVSMDYTGHCTPNEFDRVMLTIISSMMQIRDKEIKSRGGDISFISKKGKIDFTDNNEYTKR